MRKNFDTEEQAKKEASNMEGEQAKMFCPLINGSCNLRCVCYIKPNIRPYRTYVEHNEVTKYEIFGCRCGNAMFAGDV